MVESLQSLPNGNTLLAFCKYDWLYKTSKKKNNASSFVSYFIAGKGWRTCTWASEDDNYDAPLITRMGLKLLCFYSDHVMASEKMATSGSFNPRTSASVPAPICRI